MKFSISNWFRFLLLPFVLLSFVSCPPPAKIHLRGGNCDVFSERRPVMLEETAVMEGDPEVSQWLVHMKHPITKHAKSRVNHLLGEPYQLSQYFPHASFLLVAPEEIVDRISRSPDVQSVSHYDQVGEPFLVRHIWGVPPLAYPTHHTPLLHG